MGRAENRKKKKFLNRRLTPEQFERLNSRANKELIDYEVNNQIKFYQALLTECMIEAFKQNKISTDKAKMVLQDIEMIMLRKIEEKKNGTVK